MKSSKEYLDKTESAFRVLLEGIDDYVDILRAVRHDDRVEKQHEAQTKFSAELFALATLAGGMLQISFTGIEWFSTNTEAPRNWSHVTRKKQLQFCIGPQILGVPIGLVIYAGRNQYAHMNEAELMPLNTEVFSTMASEDPMFNLASPFVQNYAANITGALGWRGDEGYAKYRMQMEEMLP